MRQPGRISSAHLSVVIDGVEVVPRPRPPADLTEEQATEWIKIVNRLPADWFPPETHSMLVQLCRHIVASRKVAQLISACERRRQIDLDQYDKLLKMQERETRAIATLTTKLRINPATTQHGARQKPSMTPSPWEVDDEDHAHDDDTPDAG